MTDSETLPENALARMTERQRVVYRWLIANGVAEWLPQRCSFRIRGKRLTYSAFTWERGHERGFNGSIALNESGNPIVEQRTVDLVEPPSPEVKAALLAEECLIVDLR